MIGARMLGVGAAVAGTLIAAGGVGLASTSGSSTGVISACYSRRDGTLRVIDPKAGQHCRRNEAAVSWNQAGPQGPAGPAGPPATSNIFWATLDASGNLLHTSGAYGSYQAKQGEYFIAFNHDVTNCAAVVTVNQSIEPSDKNLGDVLAASAVPQSGPIANQVEVQILDHHSTGLGTIELPNGQEDTFAFPPTDQLQDAPFSIEVLC